MATTVAKIAKEAFDAVAAELPDVIADAVMSYDTQGVYDTATGQYATTPNTFNGRAAIGTSGAISKKFPAYVAGPNDLLISLEGFSEIPKIGYLITINSVERTIKAVGDIAGVGDFFEVIAA